MIIDDDVDKFKFMNSSEIIGLPELNLE